MCGQAQEKMDGRCRGGYQDDGNKMLEEKNGFQLFGRHWP